MGIRFFNTLTRAKEEFMPLEPGMVRMYTCGPTVYDFAHIGNFRAYCFEDILRRYLKYRGFKVIQVMNITDVDDKIIRNCTKLGVSASDFTAKYIEAFFQDIAALNIEPAEYYPRATEYIPEMVNIIKGLLDKGIAYAGDDGSIYYAISRFPSYGVLSHFNAEDLKAGVRIRHDEYDKERASDFALWKSWDEADGDVFWETELGSGRPGWHIECSAMSMKYLGPHFDIHTGGVDNIFPHHENEIAQSEAFTGQKFVNYWLHCEHLLVAGQKMAKSLGNYYTLRDITDRGFDPLALRYFYISNHYRSRLNFTFDALHAASSTLDGLKDFLRRCSKAPHGPQWVDDCEKAFEEAQAGFLDAMDDDLNSPRALSFLFTLVGDANRWLEDGKLGKDAARKLVDFFIDVDRVLGLKLHEALEERSLSPEEEEMIRDREEERRKRDYKRADEIRACLKERGILLEDTPQGVRWKFL